MIPHFTEEKTLWAYQGSRMCQWSEKAGVPKQRRGGFSYHEHMGTDDVMYHGWSGRGVSCYGQYIEFFPSKWYGQHCKHTNIWSNGRTAHEVRSRSIWKIRHHGEREEIIVCTSEENTLWNTEGITVDLVEPLNQSHEKIGVQDEPIWQMWG